MGFFSRLFGRRAPLLTAAEPRVYITQACLSALDQCLAPSRQRSHEGVAYLLGRTDGVKAVCLMAVRPEARTGPGYFQVSAAEMARVVEVAMDLDLQIVAQVHTHPVDAFHSDGDEDGANIRYDGFVSIVLPVYGTRLPDLTGAAIYLSRGADWITLDVEGVIVTPTGLALDGP